ncbi:MAG: hypothetical protein C0485_04945 [Pirellula sp.]|nr:hypothetical protein [Pirellula sp.]
MKTYLSFGYFLLLALVVAGAAIGRPTTARADLIARDDFEYSGVGSDLHGNGSGVGFADSWSGNTSYNIASGSLNSPRDPLPLVGNSVSGVAYGENRGIDRTLSAPLGTDDTSIYVSVLMEPRGILGQGAYGGWFGLALRGSTDIVIGLNYGGGTYGLQIAGEYRSSGIAAAIGKSVFLVLRMDFTEGVESAYLYVNPQPGAPEPTTAQASEINLSFHSLSKLSLTGPGGSAFDAIRIGTTFADVAPATSDFDVDGDVDGDDLQLWNVGFGKVSGATPDDGDANADGGVDGRDFLIWQRQFGFDLTSESATAVPEPGTYVLLMLGATVAGNMIRLRVGVQPAFAAGGVQ